MKTPKWIDEVLRISKYKVKINKASLHKSIMLKFKTAKAISVRIGSLGRTRCVLYKSKGRVKVHEVEK